jgi:hypothetical protein
METHAEPHTETELLEKYLDSLSEKEKKAYIIARTHLGSSFSLVKSLGYLEWKSEWKSAQINRST